MDALRLLFRGSRTKKKLSGAASDKVIPSAQDSRPQLFASSTSSSLSSLSKKRKRGESAPSYSAADEVNFFSDASKPLDSTVVEPDFPSEVCDDEVGETPASLVAKNVRSTRSSVDRRALLKQHKIKVNVLGGHKTTPKFGADSTISKHGKLQLYPDPILTFDELALMEDFPKQIVRNLAESGFKQTTEVQMVTLDLELAHPATLSKEDDADMSPLGSLGNSDVLTVAPTGSGKTLAFLIPTIVRIMHGRTIHKEQGRHTAALILAPTKELVDQIVNDGRRLSNKTGIKVSSFRKGMLLAPANTVDSEASVVASVASSIPMVKSDILVSTPGALFNALETSANHTQFLHSIRYLILDEADVLLDPLFREQTLGIWHRLRSIDLSVSLWSATMGSNIEELAQSIIQERRKALSRNGSGKPNKRALIRVVVGLKDSAVPNVEHKLIYAATEQGKLLGLRQLLHPTTASTDTAPSLRPPFIIFTQTIERAIALHSELLYDIPAEAGGINRIAVLHSGLSDTARESVMTRFRKGEIWVLITTDLLSRGIDFRGVNGVVNYDIPSSSAAYVHRVGRTGRAGREGGVAVTLYSKEDIPYLKHVANVVAAAQREKGGVNDGTGVQKWLLDALPTLSKNEKQRLKKHGVEVRTARGMTNDAKAARRARISTKAGYDRREENRKRQAIDASKRRITESHGLGNADDDDDFGGFD